MDKLTNINEDVAKLMRMRQQIAVAIAHQEARFRSGTATHTATRCNTLQHTLQHTN